jgi:hypothetical protein
VSIWKFVEKLKNRPPKTAREFAGFPEELEWKEVGPTQDDRVMADGRPAWAWWNEIQALRAQGPTLQKQAADLREQYRVLRLAEWAFMQDAVSGEVLLRIKRLPLCLAQDPETEILNHPEKYCSIERAAAKEKEPR